MIADYSAEIKIVIVQSVSECHGDERRYSSNCGQIAAKIARFNSINSENIERKFTKCVHDLAWILPFNPLKADLRSATLFSNAEARSKGHPSTWCLRPSSKFKWLPQQRPFGDCQTNHPHHFVYQLCKVGQVRSRIFQDIWRDMPIFAVSQK